MDKRDPKEWKQYLIGKFELEQKGKKWLYVNTETMQPEYIEDWELDGIAAKWAKKHK